VDFNSPVKAGQVLAQIDPATYSATVHQNEADLANAKAALELSQLSARRAEELIQKLLIRKPAMTRRWSSCTRPKRLSN